MDNHQDILKDMAGNLARVIIGKPTAIKYILIALLCESHILIEDVPGVGKTSLAAAMAKTVDCSFRRIQFTPDIMPSDITGFSMYNRKTDEFEYREGLVMSSFVLADEINRTSPKTQASLLEVMEENQVTVDGVTYKVPSPFMVIATQNPTEYLGTYPLPEAQIDRFIIKMRIGYPAHDSEVDILRRHRLEQPLAQIGPVTSGAAVVGFQRLVKEIFVEKTLYDYIVSLVAYTRDLPEVELGASPRGSLMLFRAAQALAFLSGRGYVLPDDITEMAPAVLSHRVIVRQEARIGGTTPEDIVAAALKNVPLPKVSKPAK